MSAIPAFSCQSLPYVCLLDYAYLALNVYHDLSDVHLLGHRPPIVSDINLLEYYIDKSVTGWYQLRTPQTQENIIGNFYADFYIKIYARKIQHTMIAVRGTVPQKVGTVKEDAATWWQAFMISEHMKIQKPSYWSLLFDFVCRCEDMCQRMKTQGLLSTDIQHHATGHSLGGALANLISATGQVIMQPPVDVVSFNAPGIGAMLGVVDQAGFLEGQVVSMRAHYDWVSTIGVPYGYVINNAIPEQQAAAKLAMQEKSSVATVAGDALEIVEVAVDPLGTTFDKLSSKALISVSAGKAFLAQHSMNYFLAEITRSTHAHMHYLQLVDWAQAHGGWNHAEQGPDLV